MAETKKGMTQLDSAIKPVEEWFSKLPPLPANAKELIVSIAPWLALIFGVLGLLGSLAVFGLGTVLAPLVAVGGGVAAVGEVTIAVLVGLVSSILAIVAFKPLLDRKVLGWQLMFLGEVISLIGSILTFSLGSMLFALIWFYILFQIKSYYK